MNNIMFKILKEYCDLENAKLKINNSKLRYEIFQVSSFSNDLIKSAYLLTKFYNEHFSGNVDFMHIPTFKQVIEDINHYPIIIARKEGSRVILGASILKYNDPNIRFDPYYNSKNPYFSITGILTNDKNRSKGYYGVGKKIYEIIIESVLKYQEVFSNINLMCVIDCRNNNSINALKKACRNLNINSEIVGIYTVSNNTLLEAPTFVIEVNKGKKNNNLTILNYMNDNVEKEVMYDNLLDNLINNFEISNKVCNIDDCGLITYYELENKVSIEDIIIYTNNTELGNNRIPISRKKLNLMVKNDICMMYQNMLSSVKVKKIGGILE